MRRHTAFAQMNECDSRLVKLARLLKVLYLIGGGMVGEMHSGDLTTVSYRMDETYGWQAWGL